MTTDIWKEDNATPNEDVNTTPIRSKVLERKVKMRITIPPLINVNVKGFNIRKLLRFNTPKNQE